MSTQQHKIEIDAYLKTHLNDLDKVTGQLRKGLEEGTTKIDLTKGMGKELSKLITKFQAESSKLKGMIPDNMLNLSDSKNFQAAGASIISTFRQIQQAVSDINTKSIIDVKKMFPDAFDSRVDQLSKRLESFATRAADIGKRSSELAKAQERLTNLENELSRINGMKPMDELQKEVDRTTDSLNKAAEAAKNLREQLANQLSQSPIDEKQFEEAEKQVTDLSKSIDNLKNRAKKIDAGGITKKGSSYAIGGKNIKEWEQEKKGGNAQAKEAIEVLQLYRKQNKELETQQQLLARGTLLKSAQQKKPEEWTKQEAEAVAAAFQKTEQLAEANKNAETAAKAATEAQKNLNKAAQAGDKKAKIEIDISESKQKIEELKTSISNLRSAGDLSGLKEAFKALGVEFAPQMLESAEGIQTLQGELNKIDATAFDALKNKLRELGGQFPQIAQALNQFENSMSGARVEADKMFDTMKEVDQLKSRITYFLGLTNTINLFKRTVRSAMETVKELDAVMTETAVVTDFTIGDMWDKLPEYSSKATQLGSSIQDLYSATTLYYQQGLKTEAAMGVGIETMKMARIANLEAGDATQYMTAALRGFNMEVNETNAMHVNDVYSELAAITAADTSQIATAMSKTASIAKAANMEFETTAALLAQIIETTQEAPETAGTAMKTIIARFTEVKELFTEGMLSGEDEDGEIIDINKIDAALRSVGISLRDFLNGNKGIDDIFLELAEKWDTLDLATQRYIATAAAGSRQQSRFIAMMSNYGRTMELVSAANNSAGASQEQFGKTLESLEAKTQKLQNAWAEFTMGLANNEILKFGVDVLTGLLTIVNKVIDVLSGNSGIAKSLLTLTLAITALKGLKTIFAKIFGSELVKTAIASFDKVKAKASETGIQSGNKIREGVMQGVNQACEEIVSKFAETGPRSAQAFVQGYQSGQSVVTAAPITQPGANPNPVINTPKSQPKTTKSSAMTDYAIIGGFGAAGIAASYGGEQALAKDEMSVAGKSLDAIGKSASVAASGLMMLRPILQAIGASFGTIALYAAGAVAAIGVIVALAQAAHNASPEGALERAEIATKRATEAADAAKQGFDDLNATLDSLSNKYDGLDELTRGTKEWAEQVHSINDEILDLIDRYPALAAFVQNKNGVLTLDTSGEIKNEEGKTYDQVYTDYENAVTNSRMIKMLRSAQEEAARPEAEKYKIGQRLDLEFSDINMLGNSYYSKQSGYVKSEQIVADLAEEIYSNPQVLAKSWEEQQAYIAQFLKDTYGSDSDKKLDLYAGQFQLELADIYNYKREALNSEAEIEAIYSSFVSEASAQAGINNAEYREMASNFITDDKVKKYMDEEKNKYLETGITDIERALYASSVLGGKYENGKFYDANNEEVNNVTDEVVASELGMAKAIDTITAEMIAFADKIDSVKIKRTANGKDFGIKNLYSKSQGQGLTLTDFENFGLISDSKAVTNETDIQTVAKDLWANNVDELSKFYASEEEFINYFVENVQLGAEQYNKAISKLGEGWWEKGVEGLFGNQGELDTGSMSGIINSLYGVFLNSGKQASDELGNLISSSFSGLSTEDAQLFANALSGIDWTSIDSIEQLSEDLITMGFDVNAAGIDIEGLEDKIKELGNATKKVSLESLKEQIQTLGELGKDLADRENTDRTFTDEEKKALIRANPDMADNFVMTNFDEWTYIGDSMTSLEEAVRNATQALWETYNKQVTEAGIKSQAWQDLVENGRTWEGGKSDYDILQQLAIGKMQAEDLGALDWREIIKLMTSMGMFGEGADISKYSQQDLIEILASNYNAYGAVQVRTENIAAYKDEQASNYATAHYSAMSGQDIITAEGVYGDLTTTEDVEARNKALAAMAATEEGLTKEIEASSAALGVQNDLMAASAIDAAKDRKEMSKLAEVINDNEEALKKGAKAPAEYQRAIEKITIEAKKAFGDNITAEFVANNIEAFQAWAQGAEGSTEKIRAALEEVAYASIDNADEVRAALSGLDDLSFDVYGNADFSAIFNELATLMGSAQAAADFIESMGWSLNWKIVGWTPPNDKGVRLPIYQSVISDTANRARQSNAIGNKSSGGGGKSEPYENSFDKLYNLVREIGEEVREMARIERKYEKLMKKDDISAGDLYDNLVEQLNQLGREQGLNERLRDERRAQIQDYLAKNSDLAKYANIFQDEEGKDVLRINWDQIDLVQDPDKGQRIEDYVGQLEEWMDGLDDIEEELWEIEDQIEEIQNTGKDEYLELEEAVKNALEFAYQEEIDKLTDINNSINDTNSKLISAIQKQVSKIRQDRENDKREEELGDKQRKLLYLSQDTSGANDLAILQLQKEINEGTEDYTDTLVDQKINELQEQNEEAAEQREKQIQLMQAQLDQSIKTGQIWNEVYVLFDEGLDPTSGLVRGSQLEALLKNAEGFAGMSKLQQMEWLKELEQQAALATVYLNDLKNIQPTVSNTTNNYYSGGTTSEPAYNGGGYVGGGYVGDITSVSDDVKTIMLKQAFLRYKLNRKEVAVDGIWGPKSTAAWNAYPSYVTAGYKSYASDLRAAYYQEYKKTAQFKTGGLADFTGPAWLDGTKSRPEMVLNARDTQNFIQLKDILSSLLNRTPIHNSESTENNGDITYDIDINVETMNSDYDVEQVANKVKSLINEDARYRNNNTVSLKR